MDVVLDYDPEDATEELLALYITYDWWADRAREDVRRALDHTDALVALRDRETGTVVAAARVLTDYTFYAMVYDVIVAEERRGEGLGRQLLEAVVDHPDLAALRGISLLSREGLVPFYESCGFARSRTTRFPIPTDRRNRFGGYAIGVSEQRTSGTRAPMGCKSERRVESVSD